MNHLTHWSANYGFTVGVQLQLPAFPDHLRHPGRLFYSRWSATVADHCRRVHQSIEIGLKCLIPNGRVPYVKCTRTTTEIHGPCCP